MEKEIQIEQDKFTAYFSYEEFELESSEVKDYKVSLELVSKGISHFIQNELSIEKEFIININLCGDTTIQDINNEHRGKDKVTDVLSFPLQEDIRNNDYDNFLPEIELGDIFICHSVCEKQAEEFKISYQDEFMHLLVHGLLHVLGYDHEISEEEETIMEGFEKKVLDFISSVKGSHD